MLYLEAQEQIALVKLFDLKYPSQKWSLFHIPNGVNSNQRTGARLKALGLRPGVPDLQLLIARGGFHGLFIEMKSATGQLSQVQRHYRDLITNAGYRWALCRSAEEGIEIIDNYIRGDDNAIEQKG